MKKSIIIVMITLVFLLSSCSKNDSEMGIAYKANGINQGMYSTNDENYADIVEHNYVNTLSFSVSTFGVDVDTASYSNIRRLLKDEIVPPANAVRIEEMVNYFNYDLIEPGVDEVIGITTEISTAPWNEDHKLLMIGLKTEAIDFADTPGNNLVFLLDVSGSMNSNDKLPLLKEAIKMLVHQLRPEDRISIVVYAGAAGLVLDGADGSEADTIIEAIDSLSAGGSTAGGAGINLAYSVAMDHFIEGGNNRVILGTDGDFNVGVSANEDLETLIEEKRESGVFLSVCGFGTRNFQDSKMELLADKGNGVYHYIDSLLEAKKVFVDELGGTLITVAKDVKLQIEFNPLTVKGYRLIGYENRLLDYEDFDNDEIDSGDMGAGHEVIAFYEIIPASSHEVVEEADYEQPEVLKYNGSNYSDELMTLSIRYKDPESNTSQLVEETVSITSYTDTPSNSFMYASAVVEFGLLLRDSDYKGSASFDHVIAQATLYQGADENGYRQEFITLVQTAKHLIENE